MGRLGTLCVRGVRGFRLTPRGARATYVEAFRKAAPYCLVFPYVEGDSVSGHSRREYARLFTVLAIF